MAKERGWWTLNTTVEPSETDLEHIAELIKQGYTEGEIVHEEDDIDKKASIDCFYTCDEHATCHKTPVASSANLVCEYKDCGKAATKSCDHTY